MGNDAKHGEYKVPGGKLVVIDLEVENDRILNIMLSGDFFLEPPEALDSITAALRGAPVDAGAEELTNRIETNLPPAAAMIGFSPQDVAIAVRRALS